MELRCPNGIRHLDLVDGCIEVKCRSSRCGAGPGVVVLHRFDAITGELLKTLQFKSPSRKEINQERRGHGARHNSAAVRSA